MESNEYKCAMCNGIFELVRNEGWGDEKAEEEYKRLFPNGPMENRDIVCDDCWQLVRPDRNRR